ncbi:MAG: response regulator [Spirochaetaceae bacterium]|nr:MAG: response regulator [Spirochaetaceae bacterium]
MKILIVEDSRFSRTKTVRELSEKGFDLIEASDGRMGLELAREQKPDCILCDLLMPGVDGFEFLRAVKREGLDIPVIVITADIQETTSIRVRELGAWDVVHKPPKLPELIEKIGTAAGKASG